MKKVLSLLLSFFIFLGVFSPIFAQDLDVVEATSEAEVNSFELFWPIVAGKTKGDSLYILKTLKEKVRGFFIFGKAQKADYQIFLATKRVVEAEKLINDGKEELAIKTLDEAEESIEKARENWDKVENKAGEGSIMVNIKKQLTNIEIFLNYFVNKNEGSVKERINELNSKVTDFIISF